MAPAPVPVPLADDAPHLLVVDDDRRIRDLLSRYLSGEGYRITTAGSAAMARAKLSSLSFDLLILDVMMPGETGFEFARHIRETSAVPILMLTARDAVEDRIRGLDAGADDYLVKPFAFGELLARVRAMVRRGKPERPAKLTVDGVVLDPAAHTVRCGETLIDLTPKEFSLLEFLMRHPREVLSRPRILEHVWDINYDGFSNVVDVYVGYLRRKLPPPYDRTLIRTVRGVGYQVGTP